MMGEVLSWWFVVQVLGLAVLPLAWRIFASLPDRGYAFAKPLGIFLTSYILWILSISSIAKNSRETLFFIVILLAALSWAWGARRSVSVTEATTGSVPVGKGKRISADYGRSKVSRTQSRVPPLEIIAWLRANVRIIAIEEALFLFAFLLWSFFKAYNPEILATEKPMEIAFLNGILRSEYFPPLDPWLSGYSISYYYFGYVMMAVLTRLSGLIPSVAFNLTLALNFSLTVTGAFCIVYNLIARRTQQPVLRKAVAAGVLASFFVAGMGNLQGFLEFFYAHGMGSQAFWKAVGIDGMDKPYVSGAWYPTTNWWWWKASRVIGTPGPMGDYTINEFPFFSFMLGDNHPHVLALPYVLMVLGFALSLLLGPHRRLLATLHSKQWLHLVSFWWLPSLLLVGLFFLNSWDFPTYTLIATVAYTLRVYQEQRRLDQDALYEIGLFVVPVVIIGVIFYLPFFLTFQSQAGGIGAVRVRTQLHHFLIIFGPFLFMIAGFLTLKIGEWRQRTINERVHDRIWLMPLVIVFLVVAIILVVLQLWTTVTTLLFSSLTGVLVSLLLLFMIALALICLLGNRFGDISDLFALVLVGVGCLVLWGPEWLYLEDGFSGNLSRMNTVFKFHYQGWLLLALAAAYSLYRIASGQAEKGRASLSILQVIHLAGAAVLIIACSFYTVMAFYTKANMFQGTPTLDGLAYMQRYHPDEYAAIQWLRQNVKGTPVIVESVGGSFTEYARISAHTGLPTVLGWPGHEVQWRGSAKGWEAREGDVNRIYATTDVNETKNLLRKYTATYVYVGRLEREAFGADGKPKYDATALGKFATFMDTVFQQGNVAIYRVRE